jgi:hypothetical protein
MVRSGFLHPCSRYNPSITDSKSLDGWVRVRGRNITTVNVKGTKRQCNNNYIMNLPVQYLVVGAQCKQDSIIMILKKFYNRYDRDGETDGYNNGNRHKCPGTTDWLIIF